MATLLAGAMRMGLSAKEALLMPPGVYGDMCQALNPQEDDHGDEDH